MNRSSTIFLQLVVVLVGIFILAFLLWEPQIEGRNVHATFFEIYFNDLFLACAYTASIPIFVALYQAFKVLGYVRLNRTFSQATVKSLRTIKYCAMAVAASALAAVAWLFLVERGKDDIAGGVAMGLFLILVSVLIATVAAMFEGVLQNAVGTRTA